jgi:amino acid transporter
MAINKYASDYETVVTIDEKGREKKQFVYRGDYYDIALDQNGIDLFRRNSFLLLAAIISLHVISGFVSNQGMYQFFVALPYVIAFFPLLYMAASIIRLPKEKRSYRRDEIELSYNRLKTTSIVLFIFICIGVIGEIIFMLFFSTGSHTTLEFLYLALEALAAAAAYLQIRMQKSIQPMPQSKED